ncbi:MAG: hypothetical protein V4474_01450 [Patescibacteria group bacterium]
MAENIYVCLENTLETGVAELAADHIRMALKASYPDSEAVVELVKVRSYSKAEYANIPLTMLRRTAEDTKVHKATLAARVVPMIMASQISWNVHPQHAMLLVTTTAEDGSGDWIGTPAYSNHEPHDSFTQVLDILTMVGEEIDTVIQTSPEVTKLSRLIVGALQCNSFSQKH